MSEPIRILSTKKLLPNQRQFLLNAGFSVLEANFIETVGKKFELEDEVGSLIFTSQNAVKSFLENKKSENFKSKKIFCVGTKTKALLEQNGYKVLASKEYASELAEIIVNDFQGESFVFFSGSLRRDTIPEALQKANISLKEIEVYETILTPQKVNGTVDGILFFSPSGVQSYLKENTIENQICFCIGTTTAEPLEQITDKIIIAKQQTVENVIIQAINYYSKKL
ncbi:uroporphyrinogen-III synthase [Flavobacterium microcysteis]|uniref:Uroporphyrinogen-III synthase n=1 Tax=Flavobacterium microcysteis TaxID=2596891 RepID=A0A501QHT5_9FLAO|nr:uroporphyrinogen-III synthase [Flavobacterium microcysteis]TPD72022.1 uroporphyrinogen-III synthase [Flavobacterium microcysteis]